MALEGTYTTGTALVANGSTTVVGFDTLWTTVAVAGDFFIAGGMLGYISEITDDTHLELEYPWPGPDISGDAYQILKFSAARYDPAITQAKQRALLEVLTELSIIYNVTGDEPDPDLGEEGQYALKANSSAWLLWLKQSGVWVLQGSPVGTNWTGAWLTSTVYAVNDVAEEDGTSYISIEEDNLGNRPSESPTKWEVLAQKGDRGADGGPITIHYTFSTITADADPGPGVLQLDNATQNAATTIRADLLDSAGNSWANALGHFGTSTATIKAYVRLFAYDDPDRFILFSVSAVASPTGYKNITVAVIDYSAANPFIEGEDVVLAGAPQPDKGDTGSQGSQGIPGTAGANGNAATITVGTVTAGAAGSDPEVTNVGNTQNAIFDFVIPRGNTGDTGAQGTGIQPDATGTLDERDAYDAEAQGFIFMQTDVSPFALWVKGSASSGDWEGPTYIGGEAAIGDWGLVTDSVGISYDYGSVA